VYWVDRLHQSVWGVSMLFVKPCDSAHQLFLPFALDRRQSNISINGGRGLLEESHVCGCQSTSLCLVLLTCRAEAPQYDHRTSAV